MKRDLSILGFCAALLFLWACSDSGIQNKTTPEVTQLATPELNGLQPSATVPAIESTPSSACSTTLGLESGHLVEESYPDGSSIPVGTTFSKTWTIANSGETIWTEGYRVKFYAAPQGEMLGVPESVPIGRCVLPGEEVEVSMEMVAPENSGQYTVVFQLINSEDQVVPVDGGNFWVNIYSGSAPAESSSFVDGVTVALISIEAGETQTRAELCFDFPSEDGWLPLDVTLVAGSQTFGSEGGSLGTYPFRCYYSNFSVGSLFLNQQNSYQIVVGKITPLEIAENHKQECEQIKPHLTMTYPGLDFVCLEDGSGQYVSNLVVPEGFTSEQMEVIVNEAIQGVIYGPWIISITS